MSDGSISEAKWVTLREKLLFFGVKEEDLEEKFVLSSGKGGQKVNKTASAVQLRHIPTDHLLFARKYRSRELNRYDARKRLLDWFQVQVWGKNSPRMKQTAKIRKQKKRRQRRHLKGDSPPGGI